MQAIADIAGGNPANGRLVFERVCLNCHKVGGQGADLGVGLAGAGVVALPHQRAAGIEHHRSHQGVGAGASGAQLS